MEIKTQKPGAPHRAATHSRVQRAGARTGNFHIPVHLSREAREGRQRRTGGRHLGPLGQNFGEAQGSKGAGGTNAAPGELQQLIQQAAAAYGANPKVLSEIARRESNFNTGDISNTTDSNARRGTPSRGILQFIEPTFQSMAPRAVLPSRGAAAPMGGSRTD